MWNLGRTAVSNDHNFEHLLTLCTYVHVLLSGEICKLTGGCLYWTYNHQYKCYLKDSDGGVQKRDGYVSGEMGCPN